eukprot:1172019-Rhodomonas_salina.2
MQVEPAVLSATRTLCDVRYISNVGICLRVRYAMSGTEVPYGGIYLRAWYAMSGTEVAYDAMRCLVSLSLSAEAGAPRLVSPYALAMRCPAVKTSEDEVLYAPSCAYPVEVSQAYGAYAPPYAHPDRAWRLPFGVCRSMNATRPTIRQH